MVNVIVFGLLAWLGIWFFASDEFYIDQIRVQGNERIPSEVIAQASGLRGYSIFWVHPHRIAAQVEVAIPPIERVQVRYGLPNIVEIQVLEKSSQLMWEFGGERYWVDDDGSLHLVEEGCEASLVVQDVRTTPPARIESEALEGALQLTRLLPELRMVEYGPEMGLQFVHPRGWEVYLGTGADMPEKIGVLRAMEVEYAGQQAGAPLRVDLRYRQGIYLHSDERTGGGE
jgi:cell division septal protein FtsQ